MASTLELRPTLAERCSRGLSLALLLAGSLSLSYQGVALRALLDSPPAATTTFTPHPRPAFDPQQLARLFGEPNFADTAIAPTTTLQLQLLAAFSHPQATQSSAIIAQSGQQPRRYRVGETIAAGVTLATVERQHVTLSRNGRRESLYFPEKPDARHASTRQSSTAPQLVQRSSGY